MSTAPSIAATAVSSASTTPGTTSTAQEKRYLSIFDVPANFFEACHLLSSSATSLSHTTEKSKSNPTADEAKEEPNKEENNSQHGAANSPVPRWTCNTCKAEFESLDDQRSHFKSDIHRINVKLSIAGKDILNEEDIDELTSDSFKDYDISSVSGSEDEADKDSIPRKGLIDSVKQQKLYVCLETGERVSVWKCLLLNEHESVSFENDKSDYVDNVGSMRSLRENEVIERLKFLIHEPRDNTHLRIVLLARGGHFAGCVFDGNSVVAHKTFHRYVVRAKAGKKQSAKDGSGKAAHSAGASLRRYNELSLKKDVKELLAAWKPYFDASSCIFFYAPSSNRQLFFDGDKAHFSNSHSVLRNVPLSVRRPTLKEARRIYNQLTQVAYEVDEIKIQPETEEGSVSTSTITDAIPVSVREGLKENIKGSQSREVSSTQKKCEEAFSSGSGSEALGRTTPLHEAAKLGDFEKVLELLEEGLDPCIKDERGRTPYMLANEKEVRNTFRRFMASNVDRWDWNAAKVPSALTKEMEESQAAKQAEKEAKKKARAKELKKLRKAREKKAQAEAASSPNGAAGTSNRTAPVSVMKGQSQSSGASRLSKEEELKRAQAAEREKRAAAAERRIAATAAATASGQGRGTDAVTSTAQTISGSTSDIICSCCNASLAGKIPFHRYNYKYCSTSCMHVHREILEDG